MHISCDYEWADEGLHINLWSLYPQEGEVEASMMIVRPFLIPLGKGVPSPSRGL